MVKTLIALRHMCVTEFGVEFIHEKVFRDLGYRIMWDNSTHTRNKRDKAEFE